MMGPCDLGPQSSSELRSRANDCSVVKSVVMEIWIRLWEQSGQH